MLKFQRALYNNNKLLYSHISKKQQLNCANPSVLYVFMTMTMTMTMK